MSRELIGARGTEIDRPWMGPQAQPLLTPYAMAPTIDITPSESAGLNHITTVLWRRKGTILAMTALGLLLGGLVSWLMPRTYRARASVQLQGFSNDQAVPISNGVPNASAENYLQNQVKVLESETLARRVADTPGIGTAAVVSVVDSGERRGRRTDGVVLSRTRGAAKIGAA